MCDQAQRSDLVLFSTVESDAIDSWIEFKFDGAVAATAKADTDGILLEDLITLSIGRLFTHRDEWSEWSGLCRAFTSTGAIWANCMEIIALPGRVAFREWRDRTIQREAKPTVVT